MPQVHHRGYEGPFRLGRAAIVLVTKPSRWLMVVGMVCVLATAGLAKPLLFRSAVPANAPSIDPKLRYLCPILEQANISVSEAQIQGDKDRAFHRPYLEMVVRRHALKDVQIIIPGVWKESDIPQRWIFKPEWGNGDLTHLYLSPALALNSWEVSIDVRVMDRYVPQKKPNLMDKLTGMIGIALPIINQCSGSLDKLNISMSDRFRDKLTAAADVWKAVSDSAKQPDTKEYAVLDDLQAIRWIDDYSAPDETRAPPRFVLATVSSVDSATMTDRFADKSKAVEFVESCKHAPALLFAFEVRESILQQMVAADPTLSTVVKASVRSAVQTNDAAKLKTAWDAADAIVTSAVDSSDCSDIEWGFLERLFVRRVADLLSPGVPAADSTVTKVVTLLSTARPELTSARVRTYIGQGPGIEGVVAVALDPRLTAKIEALGPNRSLAEVEAAVAGASKGEDLAPAADTWFWLGKGEVSDPVRMMKLQPSASLVLASEIAQTNSAAMLWNSAEEMQAVEQVARARREAHKAESEP
jgi:hypothetical protein